MLAVLALHSACKAKHLDEIPLGNGYRLSYHGEWGTKIWGTPDWPVLGPNVELYSVAGDLVIGLVGKPRRTEQETYGYSGYFILNTRTGNLQQGLEWDRFVRMARSMGVTGGIKLIAPFSDSRY